MCVGWGGRVAGGVCVCAYKRMPTACVFVLSEISCGLGFGVVCQVVAVVLAF